MKTLTVDAWVILMACVRLPPHGRTRHGGRGNLMVTIPETTPAAYPFAVKPYDPEDPRALHLIQGKVPASAAAPPVAPIHLLGVPFDGAVQGRKGCVGGPSAIREAFRYFTTYDVVTEQDLAPMAVVDQGDVVVDNADTAATHARAADAVGAVVAQGAVPFVLGGDHSLTYAHIQGLAEAVDGDIGIVVIDAHYDLRRPKDGLVTSGTPFWRILNEPGGARPRVTGDHLVEIGIRPFANSAHLARTAAEHGVHVYTDFDLRNLGIEKVTLETLDQLDDVDHIWLSIDMDGVDQSHAPGVSAPSPNGLMPHELFHVARSVAAHPRFAGLDILETAPNLDPTGNTARVAALAVLHAMAGHLRKRR